MSESKKGSTLKKIGKYQNAILLAKGGMGAIYKADHPTLDQPVVLKMLTVTGNDQFAQRFQREATIMMGFQHGNIVNYFDHFKTTNSYCMVMEFIDGCSVSQLLEKQRYLDDEVALLILRDTLQALNYAHQKGVIHRDVKPANILISKKGEVKLTDFGIAQHHAVDSDALTKEGMTLGTPSYMAPEQFRDAGSVDLRADLYSVGVLLYECLTGRKPFAGASLPEMLERIRKGKYEALRTIRPESSRVSRRLVRRGMRPNPKCRYKNGELMLRSLERYFKRHDEQRIRRRLADLVNDKKKTETDSKKNPRRIVLRWFFSVLASLAGLGLLLAVWWTLVVAGVLPAFLLPDTHGAVVLSVPLPAGSAVHREPGTVPPPNVVLDIFRVEDGSFREVKLGLPGREAMPDLARRLFSNTSSESLPRLSTSPYWVKPGLYQFRIRIGDKLYTRAVHVPSMRDRSISMDRTERSNPFVNVVIPWQPQPGPVSVSWQVKRSDSGSNITRFVDVQIADSTGMLYAAGEGEVSLFSGKDYDFIFSSPGYQTRTVRAWLEVGASSYDIQASLLPEYAVLKLSSSLRFRRPRIMGELTYAHGGEEGGYRRVPFLKESPIELLMPPGDYRLSYGNEERQASLDLELSRGAILAYELVRDNDKNYKWVEVKP